jgi:hypothetical protein
MLEDAEKRAKEFPASKDLKDSIYKINFYIFERNFRRALVRKEHDTAKELIDEAKKTFADAPAEKALVRLAKHIVEIEAFKWKFPGMPATSEQAPDANAVEDLLVSVDELKEGHKKCDTRLQVFYKYFNRLIANAEDSEAAAKMWDRFWQKFAVIKSESNATKKQEMLKELRRTYPKLKVLINM